MASRPDWLDYAHRLFKEREAIQDRLPPGVECTLTLGAYGHTASFGVSLTHRDSDLAGYGTGTTPAKALEAAKEDMRKNQAEQQRRPRLVGPRALPGFAG